MNISADNRVDRPSGLPQRSSAHSPLDLVHLSRQTMGDSNLECEILALFRNQCEICSQSLATHSDPQELTEIAHHMRGCAKAVGAWEVAKMAALLESHPTQSEHKTGLLHELHSVVNYINGMN